MPDQIQNPNTNPAPPTSSVPPTQTPQPSVVGWRSVVEKIKPMLKTVFNKLYTNKKIFWPVSIAFGLIFLIIILGLLFGRRGTVQNPSKTPLPLPVVQTTPQATTSGNILIDSENKLNDLKKQINALDVKQSRLQPPTLNFDIKF